MITRRYDYELFADYHQFCLQDEHAVLDPLADLWPGTSVEDMLFASEGMIHVGTARKMTVPVSIEIHDSESEESLDDWDHVTQCSLLVISDNLVLMGCTDYFPDAPRIAIEPGTYRARIFYGALDSLSWNGLEGDDHYKIALWRDGNSPTSVLKQRHKVSY